MKEVLILICLIATYGLSIGQETDLLQDSLRTVVRSTEGKEKLSAYLGLIELNLDHDAAMAMRDARRVERLIEEVFNVDSEEHSDLHLLMRSKYLLGRAYENRGSGQDARTAFGEALVYAEKLQNQEDIELMEGALARAIDSPQKGNRLGRFFGDALSKSEQGIKDLGLTTTMGLADLNEKRGNYEGAVRQLKKAADRLEARGDTEDLVIIQERINVLNEKLGIPRPPTAAPPPPIPAEEPEFYFFNDDLDIAIIDQRVEEIKELTEAVDGSSTEDMDEVAVRAVVLEQANDNARSIKLIAEEAEESNDLSKSLDYYKKYLALEQQMMMEQRTQDSAVAQIQLLQQKNKMQARESETELERQLIAKRSMAGGLGLSGALLASIMLLYRNTRRDHKKLTLAYDDLSSTQVELHQSQDRVQTLLKQHVSGAIANELLASTNDEKVERKFVCIMFLDIRDFTPFAEAQNPEDIIEYQNKVFGFMIETIQQYGGIVNQILGDGFMATFGAPVSSGNDCLNAYQAARKIIELLEQKNAAKEIPLTRVGIGLHAGNVVAGNVGTKDRKQYSITGNPVILAARLEQLNKEFGSSLVLSKEVHLHIPERLRPKKEFTKVDVKGRSTSMEVIAMS